MSNGLRQQFRRQPNGLGFIVLLLLILTTLGRADVGRGKRGMVVTVQPIASDAGARVLQEGGNAIDAAVAAALALGVVDSHNSGIAGGCFILIRTAAGENIAIDGREMAPAKATRDMYIRDGNPTT
ncbi:MAG TPA: gamma-glutamyltransferase, partial [Tepidisphaeraceae bacterium]